MKIATLLVESKVVIDRINKAVSIPWGIMLLLQDIQLLTSSCEEVYFKHVFREANFTTDPLASLGHGLSPLRLWEHGLPMNCLILFILICLGMRAFVVSGCSCFLFI